MKSAGSAAASTSVAAAGSSLRKASPTRSLREETTFQTKLAEIKQLRQAGQLGSTSTSANGASTIPSSSSSSSCPSTAASSRPEKRLIINGKPAVRRLGRWAQMKSSSGKIYYFHLDTQVGITINGDLNSRYYSRG